MANFVLAECETFVIVNYTTHPAVMNAASERSTILTLRWQPLGTCLLVGKTLMEFNFCDSFAHLLLIADPR